MSRFLFVVPPLAGHVNPAAAVAAELAVRGHRVAWAAVPDAVREVVDTDAEVYPCAVPARVRRPPGLRGAAALRFLWEDFLVPLAEAMAPGTREAVDAFRPDVLVADQQALAGALVAERLGLRWATSATTPAEVGGSVAALPKVEMWIRSLLTGLREQFGDPGATHDPRFSPELLLAYTVEELVDTSVPRVRFVGPAVHGRRTAPDFPWAWLDRHRATVLVSLGTVNTDIGSRFLAECAAAVRERAHRLQAVIADPGGRLAGAADATVLALPRVPQLDLLSRASAVVCHAGHNTVTESLWHGIPLVVAPVRDDQPFVAAQVTAAGAAVRVRFGRADRVGLGAALDTVLDGPDHRAAARHLGDRLRAAGGAGAAAGHLEALAARP
ncbi:glycosyltransferase family 1 protein [Streptomyces sp. AV19]|uniref:glycosyltransferase n=1 Tax=Streptomyces sp. AV19 TaxID=2793068 RepID=UPI0018FEB359|nr:glycosyltransferase [Streptomyces sp. AV19]MBH1932962.1 glycosyltransferase family 1 protein [Streptomyces sp. AV19]MDG4533867.1 glycosyltransferase [Streptomyces sp. AV19]